MAFEADRLTTVIDALRSMVQFFTDLRSIPVPTVPVESSDPEEHLAAFQQFAVEAVEFMQRLASVEFPATADMEDLAAAFTEIESELARTRNITVDGAESVEVTDAGINIILPTRDEGGEETIQPPVGCFPILLTQTGGTAVADDTTQADWTYTVKDLWGDTLKNAADADMTGVDPTAYGWVRQTVGYLTAATRGAAYRDTDGEVVIVFINEVADGAACG